MFEPTKNATFKSSASLKNVKFSFNRLQGNLLIVDIT